MRLVKGFTSRQTPLQPHAGVGDPITLQPPERRECTLGTFPEFSAIPRLTPPSPRTGHALHGVDPSRNPMRPDGYHEEGFPQDVLEHRVSAGMATPSRFLSLSEAVSGEG